MEPKTIKVGMNAMGYPEKRNIMDPRPPNVILTRVRGLRGGLGHLYFKLRGKNHRVWSNVFDEKTLKKVDLYHFFNTISTGKTPWIVTYENELPRHNHDSKELMEKIAGDPCRKIIALSNNARNIQAFFLERFPELKEIIMQKITVLQPPQRLYISSIQDKKSADEINFTFIGGAFFQKGGLETLEAFIDLIADFKNIKLNIVSSFVILNWFDSGYTQADKDKCITLIKKNRAYVNYHEHLPNENVIELLKRSSVALLPSYGETYGYAVLEAQACACPVITTNAWAFPEFNDNTKGWLLDLPVTIVNGGLRSDIATKEKKAEFSTSLRKQLYQVMKGICQDPSVIAPKAIACIDHIKRGHSIENYRIQLQAIYNRALQKGS